MCPVFPHTYFFKSYLFIYLFIFTEVMGAGHTHQSPVSLVLHTTCNLLSTGFLFWFNCSIFLLLHLHFQPDFLCPLFFWYNQQIHALFYFASLFQTGDKLVLCTLLLFYSSVLPWPCTEWKNMTISSEF